MRFFTLAEYNAVYEDSNDEAIFKPWQHYVRHIDSLREVLPPELIELATLPGIDDGLIVELQRIHSLEQIIFVLRCGDLQMGYFDLILTYNRASITEEQEKILRRLANARIKSFRHTPMTGRMHRQRRKEMQYIRYEPDLYRQEIDVTEDGLIEHRFLFHPGYWFAIRCTSLQWKKIDRPNREFTPHVGCF